MIVACVLKSGGEFKPDHVKMLKQSVFKHNPELGFICLSDVKIDGVECINLLHDWPKWWGKLELFRVFTDKEVLYLDLDTVVIGDIKELFRTKITMLKDVNNIDKFGSGVMSWHGDYSYLYNVFKANSDRFISEYVSRKNWGDQGFIMNHLNNSPDCFEFGDLHSYKKHCIHGVPKGTKLVYFHGNPRPWDVKLCQKDHQHHAPSQDAENTQLNKEDA